MENISISAEDFKEGEMIPSKFTCDGKDVSPLMTLRGIPANAKSIALMMDDPDAPGGTFVHWVFFNIPANKEKLPEGIPRDLKFGDGSCQGTTDFRKPGYWGPCPPPGKPHRYYFRLYALDAKLDLKPGASRKELENSMRGHILARGELMGKYKR